MQTDKYHEDTVGFLIHKALLRHGWTNHYAMEKLPPSSPWSLFLHAVLQDGIKVFVLYYPYRHRRGTSERVAFLETCYWLFEEENPDYPYSFHAICARLDLQPQYVRARVLHYIRRQQQGETLYLTRHHVTNNHYKRPQRRKEPSHV